MAPTDDKTTKAVDTDAVDTDAPTFDPTDQDAVAAYIAEHGMDAFRTERHRQTGYTVGTPSKVTTRKS